VAASVIGRPQRRAAGLELRRRRVRRTRFKGFEMICKNCGHQNDDAARYCGRCGRVLGDSAAPPIVPSAPGEPPPPGLGPAPANLAVSILVTILCCWPFGIPAIVFSARTMSANAAGDYLTAHEESKKAAMWGWISFGVGLVPVMIYLALLAIAALG
jgi:hypothetical protein